MLTLTQDEAAAEDFQHSSPTGGFVRSEWKPAERLAAGDVVRSATGWIPIAAAEMHPGGYYAGVLYLDGRYALLSGAEVRTDFGVEIETAPCLTCGAPVPGVTVCPGCSADAHHPARPSYDSEPGDRCSACAQPVTWDGPGMSDWRHV